MRAFLPLLLWLMAAGAASAQLSPKNAAGVTYGHVHLNVGDIEVHKTLWVEQFGGVLVSKGPLTAVKFPNMLIAFAQRAPSGPSQGTVMDHFGFRVRSMPDMLRAMRAAGFEVQREFTGAEGQPNAYVLGPDGLRFELQEDPALQRVALPNHVHFYTPMYRELLEWYTRTFSLAPRSRGTIETTADAGSVNLTFAGADAPRAPTRGRAIDHIGFEIQDLEAFCRQLELKGITLDQAFREVPAIGLKIAYVMDPSGVYVELTEGYDRY
ncbi:MAG: VOC family protein [Vicinamibacterales bacterium]